jgi:hypothetical protein
MPRIATALAALAVSLMLLPGPSSAAGDETTAPPSVYKYSRKKPVARWRGYGFLPGYRPPEVIERQRRRDYWASGPHFYGPAWPGFYHGRWNGGGFGPCYTYTPIGYVWNCGK